MLCLSRTFRTAAALFAIVVLTTSYVRSEPPVDEVRTSLGDLSRWLDAYSTGPGWHEYLRRDQLEAQLADPAKADAQTLAGIVRQFALGSPETDRPLFLRVRRALEAWVTQLPVPPVDELSAVAQSAKDAFVPRTNADLLDARDGLDASVARLDALLKPTDPQADRWRAYLKWDKLLEELDREDGPDLTALDAVYAKYAAGHEGLELAGFDDVRRALRRYLTTARAIGDPKLQSQYEALMDALPEYLEAYRQKPTVAGAASLESVIQWLDEAGQAPWLAAAIRHHYTRPNLFARIDVSVVAAGIAGPVDEVGPVRDVILGATVRGRGHTVGEVSVELIPNDRRAEVHTVFRGTVTSDTIAYKGPAQVFTDGVTALVTRKPLFIAADGFSTGPASSGADTDSWIKGVCAGRGGIIQNAARKRAYQQKGQAERISAQHAESQANRRADGQAAEMIGDAQHRFVSKVRDPLQERNLYPQQLAFTTTEDAIHVTGLEVGPYDLGAPNAPPKTISQPDLAVQVHESMVNNFASGAFAGVIVDESRFLENLEEMLGEVPEQFEPDKDAEPWKITFARRQPLTVTFADGQFTITMRGRRYATGDSSYPGMDVTAAYKIVKDGEVLKAVRQGEPKIFPPGFKPGSGRRLSVREQTIRRMLERRFGKIFEEEIVPEPIELPGEWEKSGKYGLTQWEAADGWMVMAWNRLPDAKAEAAVLQETTIE